MGLTLKQYDEDWFADPRTVIEMDGELNAENMAALMKEVVECIEGLGERPQPAL